jgi:hypothetical protein
LAARIGCRSSHNAATSIACRYNLDEAAVGPVLATPAVDCGMKENQENVLIAADLRCSFARSAGSVLF